MFRHICTLPCDDIEAIFADLRKASVARSVTVLPAPLNSFELCVKMLKAWKLDPKRMPLLCSAVTEHDYIFNQNFERTRACCMLYVSYRKLTLTSCKWYVARRSRLVKIGSLTSRTRQKGGLRQNGIRVPGERSAWPSIVRLWGVAFPASVVIK